MSEGGERIRRIDGLRVIGLIKLGKAVLLLATTYGLYRLRKAGPGRSSATTGCITLTDYVRAAAAGAGLDWVDSLGPTASSNILLATSAVHRVLLTEGIGL